MSALMSQTPADLLGLKRVAFHWQLFMAIYSINSCAVSGILLFNVSPTTASIICLVTGFSPLQKVCTCIHIRSSWCGHLFNRFLNVSHVSNNVSNSIWAKEKISFLILVVLVGRKYFDRSFSAIQFQVVMDLLGSEFIHYLALFLSEKENSLNLMASSFAPQIGQIVTPSK